MGLDRPPTIDPGREVEEDISDATETIEFVEDENEIELIEPLREWERACVWFDERGADCEGVMVLRRNWNDSS